MSFNKKTYNVMIEDESDKLKIRKESGTEWVRIAIETNRECNGVITIRSKQMLQQLSFLIGQLMIEE